MDFIGAFFLGEKLKKCERLCKSNSDLSNSLIYPFVGARIARPVHGVTP